jgi:hypothetical protein
LKFESDFIKVATYTHVLIQANKIRVRNETGAQLLIKVGVRVQNRDVINSGSESAFDWHGDFL